MEHLLWPAVAIVLGTIMAVIGGSIGYKLVSTRGESLESKTFNSRLGILQDENVELKKYLKSVKGHLAQTKQGATLEEGEVISEDGFDGTITSLIGKYSNMLPKNLQFLARDPAIVSFLISEAKKNPEQAKEVLKHFISKNGDANKGTGDAEREQLEVMQESGA